MKTKHFVLALTGLFAFAIMVLYSSCYGPSIDAVQPDTADKNSTFITDVTISQYSDPSRGTPEILTTIGVELPEELFLPLAENWLYFGIQLPEGWLVTDNIPFEGTVTGTFNYNDTLVSEMTLSYPPDPGYYWWVGSHPDPITVSSGTITFEPVIHTDDKAGTFWLDYSLGYNYEIFSTGDYNNMICIDLQDTVYVTSTGNSGPGSLREAIGLVNPGGTILFDLPAPALISLQEPISIYKDVNIIGPGKYQLSVNGNDVTQHFYVEYGKTLNLSDLSLIHGNVGSGRGGAIYAYNNSTLNLENVYIHNCQARYGGGIYAVAANVTLENTDLRFNTASNYGGGIYIQGGSFFMSASEVSYNEADITGGGIYIDGELILDPLQKCSIYANMGGANYGWDLYTNVIGQPITLYKFSVEHLNEYWAYPLENFTFDYQTSHFPQFDQDVYVSTQGSDDNLGNSPDQAFRTLRWAMAILYTNPYSPNGIKVLDGTYSINDPGELFPLSFRSYVSLEGTGENAIIECADLANPLEGMTGINMSNLTLIGLREPLTIRNSYVNLEEVRFTGPNLTYVDGLDISENSDVTLIQCSLTGFADGIQATNSSVVLDRCSIHANVLGVSLSDSYGNFLDCIIEHNTSGGVLATTNSNVYFYNSRIRYNENEYGGGVRCASGASVRFENSTISHNTATQMGGGIYVDDASISFDSYDRSSIYSNQAPVGSDLGSMNLNYTVSVPLDTFTVMYPTPYHACPLQRFSITCNHGIEQQFDQDLYVSTFGSDENTGTTPDDPLMSVTAAARRIITLSGPHAIILAGGKYSASATGEALPIILQDSIHLQGDPDSLTVIHGEFDNCILDLNWISGARLSDLTLMQARNDDYFEGRGGGLRVVEAEATLDRVMIESCRATRGGGIYMENATLRMNHCSVENNATSSSSGYGGGMYLTGTCNLFTDSLSIINNYAGRGGGIGIIDATVLLDSLYLINNRAATNGGYGGGIYCDNSDATLEHLSLTESRASYGAGMYILGCDPMISQVTIAGNTAVGRGGGIYLLASDPMIENTLIMDNLAYDYGGGIYMEQGSGPIIINSKIAGNDIYRSGNYSGGGIFGKDVQPVFINSEVSGNSAPIGAGLSFDNSSPVFSDVMIHHNIADQHGAGACFNYSSSPYLFGCLLTENVANENGGGLYVDGETDVYLSGTRIIRNDGVRGGGIFFNKGSLASFDPADRCNIYLNRGLGEGADLAASGCAVIDVAVDTFTVLYPTDIFASKKEGFTFDIWNYILEQGIYDLYVSPLGSDENSGQTPDDPLLTIDKALELIPGDSVPPLTIHLAAGTYSEATTGETFPLRMFSLVELKGSGTEQTILDGEGSQLIRMNGSRDLKIFDLTLKNGLANEGGAVRAENSNFWLDGVHITKCEGERGGAIYMRDGTTLHLENALLDSNIAKYGGAIYMNQTNHIVGLNAVIRDQVSDKCNRGGGIYMTQNKGYLRNLKIQSNYGKYGGGIFMTQSSPHMINMLISNNQASNGGAIGIYSSGEIWITHSTIADNQAINYAGGIYAPNSDFLHLQNNIFWNNGHWEIYTLSSPVISVNHCIVQGGQDSIYVTTGGQVLWHHGSLKTDPLFLGTGTDPYALSEGSPGIDGGWYNAIPVVKAYPWDILHHRRCCDGDGDGCAIPDMGAYEYMPAGNEWFLDTPTDLTAGDAFTLRCYPNPVSAHLKVAADRSFEGNAAVLMYNATGTLVASRSLLAGKGQASPVIINVSTLPEGVYIVRILAEGASVTKKVVVAR